MYSEDHDPFNSCRVVFVEYASGHHCISTLSYFLFASGCTIYIQNFPLPTRSGVRSHPAGIIMNYGGTGLILQASTVLNKQP